MRTGCKLGCYLVKWKQPEAAGRAVHPVVPERHTAGPAGSSQGTMLMCVLEWEVWEACRKRSNMTRIM